MSLSVLAWGVCALPLGGLRQQLAGLPQGLFSQVEGGVVHHPDCWVEKGLGGAGREFTEEEDQAADDKHQEEVLHDNFLSVKVESLQAKVNLQPLKLSS